MVKVLYFTYLLHTFVSHPTQCLYTPWDLLNVYISFLNVLIFFTPTLHCVKMWWTSVQQLPIPLLIDVSPNTVEPHKLGSMGVASGGPWTPNPIPLNVLTVLFFYWHDNGRSSYSPELSLSLIPPSPQDPLFPGVLPTLLTPSSCASDSATADALVTY